jgi:hypothetical protein
MRIDERIARCFSQLRAQEFQPFVEYLRAERHETLEALTQVHDQNTIYRLQGKAVLLGELLGYVEGAEALIAKLKR